MSETIASKGRPCAIKLSTRHRQDDDMNEFHFEKMGHVVSVNGSHYIQFDMDGDGEESVKTTFKLAKDNTVTVIRDQEMTSRMRFNPVKNTSMRYHTPHGSMLIDIHTKQIRMNYQDQPFAADVYIQYDLYSGPQAVGEYDITLHFTV